MKMNSKQLFAYFLMALFCMGLAGVSFALLESRLLAGTIAGTGFLALGVVVLSGILKWKDKWISLTFYLILVHLFFVTIPMLYIRWTNPHKPFDELTIFGLTGTQFHQVSEQVYTVLLAVIVVDWARAWWKGRGKKRNPSNFS